MGAAKYRFSLQPYGSRRGPGVQSFVYQTGSAIEPPENSEEEHHETQRNRARDPAHFLKGGTAATATASAVARPMASAPRA